MKKTLALAFTLWASCAAAQDIPNHAMAVGAGPGVVGFKFIGPCASGQVPVWLTGPTADPTCGASAVGFTIGTSTITGGVSGRVLFDNAGIAGEYPITGTAGNAVLSVGPTFTGTILAAAQTWSGTATYNGLAKFTSTFQISGTTQTFPASGLLVGTTDSQTITNKSIAGSEINSGTIAGTQLAQINLAASGNGGVGGTLPYANGGCNATTQAGCTNNIFPTPTRAGDVAYWNGAGWVTLAGNNSGTQVLSENSTGTPNWITASGSGTVTSITCGATVITTTGTCPTIAVVKIQKFTASGTYTPSTGIVYATIECVGPGGGGGGIANGSAGTGSSAGGGGSGGISRITVSAATIGASKTVTIGTVGSGGANTGTAGGTATDTSVGTLCVGKGGVGGSGAASGAGGAGGAAGTGDLTPVGNDGAPGANQGITTIGVTSSGRAHGPWGGGLNSYTRVSSAAGSAGGNYGAGGEGGVTWNGSGAATGGAGGAGIVFITEYTNQ